MGAPVEHPQDFTARDRAALEQRGMSWPEAARQLALLRQPPPPVRLARPCTIGDGLSRLDTSAYAALTTRAADAAAAGRVSKFVPASGAASRMFKDLLAARDGTPTASAEVDRFFAELPSLPFAGELLDRAGVEWPVQSPADQQRVLETLLDDMGYAERPKGLIPFHRGAPPRTAFEEHLLEATRYAADASGRVRVHFTVAPEHRRHFEYTLAAVHARLPMAAPGITLDVTFSEQATSSDTLAATPEGAPFRLDNGALLFRPGGHGALLQNLQALGGDIVIIKNIDNVVPFDASDVVVQWKRLLIGFLAEVEAEVCGVLESATAAPADEAAIARAVAVAETRFGRTPRAPLTSSAAAQQFVRDALARPLRVCGVVKNEGEPGGAPFWVADAQGQASLQIVEASQIDLDDPQQRRIFDASTHFNPVDVVCALRGCDGQPFDLGRFVDETTVFLSRKSHEGRELVALERPGLWNGGMAGWNTLFVEVPGETFAPVKTVLDLLRPQHQSL